jgi:NAD(P)-dependent dehydrogenase (short-subunit alcohol dehydrogenase family)
MRILVTAGPTREYIDAVRFITNGSSGRMGYAVAAAAARRGHKVTLLTGPERSVTLCPRRAAAAATAYPMRPLEPLVMKRTASMYSRVGPAVTRMCMTERVIGKE